MGCRSCGGGSRVTRNSDQNRTAGKRPSRAPTNTQKRQANAAAAETMAAQSAETMAAQSAVEVAYVTHVQNTPAGHWRGAVTGRNYVIGGTSRTRVVAVDVSDLPGFLTIRKFGSPIFKQVDAPPPVIAPVAVAAPLPDSVQRLVDLMEGIQGEVEQNADSGGDVQPMNADSAADAGGTSDLDALVMQSPVDVPIKPSDASILIPQAKNPPGRPPIKKKG